MAGGEQNEERQQAEVVEGKINKLEESDLYDLENADELSRDLSDLARAAREAENALKDSSLTPEEKAHDEAVIKEELREALTALRDVVQSYGDKAPELTTTTRNELDALGVVADGKPNSSPEPMLFGSLDDLQFDEWMRDLDENPRGVLIAVAAFAEQNAYKVRITAATEVAKREGARVTGTA